ncbi:MAG: DUF4433 domain-containing protein [Gammaproteobacteria bacterium]|nr:DUF4433 domain-containing protein [Gammaproteobacteria bacterium]
MSFPNHRMFYKYRQEDPDEKWVVVVVNKKVLWKYECAFCRHNAADARISCMSLNDLKGRQALQSMYEDIEGVENRDEQRLKLYDPTDAQAEVLAFNKIPIHYIKGVVFDSKTGKEEFIENHPEKKAYYHHQNKGVFASRSYVRKYVD